jgi:hypothetical protein
MFICDTGSFLSPASVASLHGKMLNYGILAEAILKTWLTSTKRIISLVFLVKDAKILVNKAFADGASKAQVIVSKRLLCHYVT